MEEDDSIDSMMMVDVMIDDKSVARSVRFNTYSQMFVVPNRDDTSQDELQACYLTETEYTQIRQRERRL